MQTAPRPKATQQTLLFGKGKVRLFSDFDGTYLPAEHKILSTAQSAKNLSGLIDYFGKTQAFLSRNPNDFKLTITTGRNFGEFQSILNHCRRLGLKMPLPDSVITKNGGDEYFKSLPDRDFYTSKRNVYTRVNTNKQQAIQSITGWNGAAIKQCIVSILNGYHFEIRQDPTTNLAEDYGSDSTLYYVHDHYDWDGSPSPWVSALRQDGKLKFFIGLPKDIMQHTEVHQDILTKLQSHLESICQKGENFQIATSHQDSEYGNHPSITIMPKIDGQPLTKVFDTRQAVTQAKNQDDLILVAGDSSNDFEMLNPARYLKLTKALERENQATHWIDKPELVLKKLQQYPDLKTQWDQLPFMGIVIERKGQVNTSLQKLLDAYSSGANSKILMVKEGELFEGVTQSIRRFAQRNPKFLNLMNPQFKASIMQKEGYYFYLLDKLKGFASSIYNQLCSLLQFLKDTGHTVFSTLTKGMGR